MTILDNKGKFLSIYYILLMIYAIIIIEYFKYKIALGNNSVFGKSILGGVNFGQEIKNFSMR